MILILLYVNVASYVLKQGERLPRLSLMEVWRNFKKLVGGGQRVALHT